MSSQEKHSIQDELSQLQESLYDISARNPFLQIKENRLFFESLSPEVGSKRLEKIYRKQQLYIKEYGLETTLKIGLFIQWKMPQKNEFFTSPLCYLPIQVVKNQKITLNYHVKEQSTAWQVNPILRSVFRKLYEVELQESYESKSQLIEHIQLKFNNEIHHVGHSTVFDLNTVNWNIIELDAVGTFNYKKSLLGQDYDYIIQQPNETISKLLGFASTEKKEVKDKKIDLSIYPLDNSQRAVIQKAQQQNMIIQGPPGTGKSHSISIFIQTLLSEGKSVLFVSEKKSALSVVYHKLKPIQNLIAYFDASKHQKKQFYKKLKGTIENLLAPAEKMAPKNTVEFEALKYQFNSYPKSILINNAQTDCSIFELESFLISNPGIRTNVKPQSIFPHFKTWTRLYVELLEIEKQVSVHLSNPILGEIKALYLNVNVLNEVNPWKKITDRINEAQAILKSLNTIQRKYKLDLDHLTFSKYCVTASVLNMVNKNFIDVLIEGTAAHVQFDKLSKRFEKIQQQFQQAHAKNGLWRKLPTIAEVENIKSLLKNDGFLNRIINKRTIKAFFRNFEGVYTSKNKEFIIDAVLKELKLEEQLAGIQLKLKHELGIINPAQEIDLIVNVRNRLANLNHSLYEDILSRENALELIEDFSNLHPKLDRFNQISRYLFRKPFHVSLNDYEKFLADFLSDQVNFQILEKELQILLSAPNQVLDFIQANPKTLEVLNQQVYYHYWTLLQKPNSFSRVNSGFTLFQILNKFNKSRAKVYLEAQQYLRNVHHKGWKELELIEGTPNQKLDGNAKELKQKFKSAKRILFHEINKKQQHLSIKQLFEETSIILKKSQPLWVMNPLAISERLPLKKDLFDVVIFDESSQIPVEDAIPALFRAKQAIVVGDEKQMPPSLFFSGKSNGLSLLAAVKSFIPSQSLLWHYRSNHPALIQFSNEQFYDLSLKVLPAAQQGNPITFNYVPNGSFKEGKNEVEAQLIVENLRTLLSENITDIGLIAFSKEQELCIRKWIFKSKITVPETVLISNLESVQGIEKQVILISIGYAKNEDGNLIQNFGPVNHISGENRLNVLFSRAINKMIVFSSVLYTDFKLSNNKGVMTLKDFLHYAQQTIFNQVQIPQKGLSLVLYDFFKENNVEVVYFEGNETHLITCFIDYNAKSILLVNPGVEYHKELNLAVLIEVLQKRFKKIKIILNSDWIHNQEKEKQALLNYFQ